MIRCAKRIHCHQHDPACLRIVHVLIDQGVDDQEGVDRLWPHHTQEHQGQSASADEGKRFHGQGLLHSGVPVIHPKQQRPDVFIVPALSLPRGCHGTSGDPINWINIDFL